MGTLQIGDSTRAAYRAGVIAWSVGGCGIGSWASTGTRDFWVDDNGPAQSSMRHATIRWLLAKDSRIKTTRGIHPGSSLAQLRAAYGAALVLLSNTSDGKVYGVKGSSNWLTFHFVITGTPNAVSYLMAGPRASVDQIIWDHGNC